jgi:type 1 glutamine amidotransferase
MNAIRPSAILAVALFLALGSIVALTPASKSSRAEERPAAVLYFTHSAGYRHEVIPASQAILKEIGASAPRFEVTASEDVSGFTPENLRRFSAVMFFTTGELPMSDAQKAALTDFVRAGGGFLGVHSATDTFYEWGEYQKLIGGHFNEHPWHQSVRIEVADRSSPLVRFLGSSFTIADEIYQIADFDERGSHVLLRLDPTSVDLKADGVHPRPYGWPLAWTRSYGEGRVFYTALGHEEAVWRDPRYQHMLRNAVLWAMGKTP